MVRKTLALLATGLILFAALLIQMTAVQAAAPKQTEPEPAVEEPLPQPLHIRINQSIPLTLNLPAALLGNAAVTRPLTTTGTLTGAEDLEATPTATDAITGTGSLTGTDEVTDAEALTVTGGALGQALANAIAGASEAVTDTEALTGTAALTATGRLTASNVLTSAPFASVPVTLELSIDLVVSNTLTTTVPSSVTLQLADRTTRTLPISVSVAALPDGEVFVELLPVDGTAEATPTETPIATATEEITATPQVTATAAVTTAATVTPTVEVTTPVQVPSGLPVVTTTATTTANLRAGPSTTTFDIVGQVAPDQTLAVVGISEDGQWYLLDGGTWIAVFLTADAAIPNLPLATQELIDQASGNAPVAPTATPAPTTVVTETALAPTPTAIPAATTAVSPTTTTDANLRAGPGTEFPIIGGTVVGQALNIVGRNADATWWRLDNTGWIFGELIANPPAADTVPVVNADGTAVEPAATPTPDSGLALPTPTPAPAGAAGASITAADTAASTANTAVTTSTVTAAGADTEYISDVQGIVTTYDGIVQTLDSLIADARKNETALTNPEWANRVNAALILLRRTAASVGELVAPAGLTGAQDSLVDAAVQYTAAGNALSQAASTGAVAQLDAAETAIQAANASLAAVETALAGAQ